MSYQVLAQIDEDYPQMSVEIDQKEEEIEYIYDDSSDDERVNRDGRGITYESDSSVDILEKTTNSTVIVDNYENYFKESRSCKNDCKDTQPVQKCAFVGVISVLAFLVIVFSVKQLRSSSSSLTASTVSDEVNYVRNGDKKPAITLEEVLRGDTFAHGFNGTWEGNDRIIYRDRHANVLLYNIQSKKTTILVPRDRSPLNEGVHFSLSHDGKYLLIARNIKKRFRRSYSAIYDVLNLETNLVQPLLINNIQHSLLLAKWSPTSNAILINYNYDLYYKTSPDAPETRITFDGSPDIFNAISDWVYEEEVLLSSEAVWFNPNGKFISFVKFNESMVPSVDLPIYGHPEDDMEHQYPTRRYIHYPKAGVENPRATLILVNLENPQQKTEIAVPEELAKENILATVAWASNEILISIWMNRIQNVGIIRKCDVTSNECLDIAKLTNDKGWLDLFSPPLFNKNGTELVLIASQLGFRHLTLISTVMNKQVALTHGHFVVTKILKWHGNSNFIFYTANMETSTESQHIFAIKAEPGSHPQCLTCSLTSDFNFKLQQYFDAEFNEDGSLMILSFKGPHLPRDYLFSWTLNDTTGLIKLQKVKNWQENSHLEPILLEKSIPSTEFHEIPITGENFTAKVMLQVPHDIDRSGKLKYPMLVDVYGGPNYASVTKKFNLDWGSYLVSNLSIIYARIDGRGSGLRGDEILQRVYKKLGTVEVEDQIHTARKLAQKLPYIDKNRIGIWGWSYGGYVSAMALTKDDQGIFKCAASVAPVTDWMFYDSIYTERYMDLPENNLKGYLNARLSTKIDGFKGKDYLMIHGTLDDNVHLQQSMALVRKLEKSNIRFKQMSYPDEDHSLAGVRPHLYQTLTDFFSKCFKT
ncbi:venom dipeptidyl peptidase 4-like [Culicoides brevitarsis]|uniref:venom dipeptidyl peptidase 4-like n=1 Tax=Culicoides brevitarsis TaxID=469753 RepID=UPI00307C9CB3